MKLGSLFDFKLRLGIIILLLIPISNLFAQHILIPMDEKQTDHLKSYGVAYWSISEKNSSSKIYWLLNYRDGSFLIPYSEAAVKKLKLTGVYYEIIDDNKLNDIEITIQEENMDKIELEKAPKIAVYAPSTNNPWDDAVTLALTYAEVPYDKIWDDSILKSGLSEYDWLHLHHEDFTGQYDKFYRSFQSSPWYLNRVAEYRKFALSQGFNSVREEKTAVSKIIKNYVNNGGFLFAMCSAPDALDISLSLEGVDYISQEIDGTPYEPDFMKKIDYTKCLVFENFTVISDPYFNPKSDIDYNWVNTPKRIEDQPFELFDFSAKFDQVPAMLTQNHNKIIKGFFGLTTSFREDKIKRECIIMGKTIGHKCVKYLHRKFGKGTVTYLGGHDPEDYAHQVGAEHTNLSLHKNSSGYRLILNNILFPAAKQKKLKT
ncbi:asparagine synthetase B [Candidatus Dependentiae bacterium]|nr:asparagine synthetase B [Candidatus Dependentiae bacterium]